MGIGLRAQAEPAARGALGLPASAANSLYDTVWPYGIRAIAVSQSQPLAVLPSGANDDERFDGTTPSVVRLSPLCGQLGHRAGPHLRPRPQVAASQKRGGTARV